MPYKKFNKLQEEFFAASKRLRETKTSEEKMSLLAELQKILAESQRVLEEIHDKQSKVGKK